MIEINFSESTESLLAGVPKTYTAENLGESDDLKIEDELFEGLEDAAVAILKNEFDDTAHFAGEAVASLGEVLIASRDINSASDDFWGTEAEDGTPEEGKPSLKAAVGNVMVKVREAIAKIVKRIQVFITGDLKGYGEFYKKYADKAATIEKSDKVIKVSKMPAKNFSTQLKGIVNLITSSKDASAFSASAISSKIFTTGGEVKVSELMTNLGGVAFLNKTDILTATFKAAKGKLKAAKGKDISKEEQQLLSAASTAILNITSAYISALNMCKSACGKAVGASDKYEKDFSKLEKKEQKASDKKEKKEKKAAGKAGKDGEGGDDSSTENVDLENDDVDHKSEDGEGDE